MRVDYEENGCLTSFLPEACGSRALPSSSIPKQRILVSPHCSFGISEPSALIHVKSFTWKSLEIFTRQESTATKNRIPVA